MQKGVYLIKTAHHEYMLANSYVDKFVISTQVTDIEYSRLVELFNKQFIHHKDNKNTIKYTIQDKNELEVMKSMFELVHRQEMYNNNNDNSRLLCLIIIIAVLCPLLIIFVVFMILGSIFLF